MLSPQVLKALHEKLLAQQQELQMLAATDVESTSAVELDQSRVGRLSRMDALAGAEMARETARRRVLQLKLIDAALQKIDDDSYGECDECLEVINPQRLALDPAAPLCVECAGKLEQH